jgi:hypothetical protein
VDHCGGRDDEQQQHAVEEFSPAVTHRAGSVPCRDKKCKLKQVPSDSKFRMPWPPSSCLQPSCQSSSLNILQYGLQPRQFWSQFVNALRLKPEGRGFHSRRGNGILSDLSTPTSRTVVLGLTQPLI